MPVPDREPGTSEQTGKGFKPAHLVGLGLMLLAFVLYLLSESAVLAVIVFLPGFCIFLWAAYKAWWHPV